jgi:antagonist of KipI
VRFLSHGEGGLVVELGDTIDPALNARVHRLARAVREALGPTIEEVVPSYRSLLVAFDPLRVSRAELESSLRALSPAAREVGETSPSRVIEIPVCYGGQHGPDLAAVAAHAGLPEAEVIRLHAAPDYLVYMLGFTPGFPYLGGLDPRLATPRLASPRSEVPGGAVAIGGVQTGIYPVPSPGGWRLVGGTPLRLFDPRLASPFLVAPGDRIRFVPVDAAAFDRIAAQVAQVPSPSPREPRGSSRGGGATHVEVVAPGLFTTVQDLGRPGWRAFGMPAAGAADRQALVTANLLAGNPPGAAALELTLQGGTFRFEAPGYAALAGADLRATLDGAPVRAWSAFPVRTGATLALGGATAGVRAYLALHGGIEVPPLLGSRSTYTRAGVGGHEGRRLRAGDRLPVRRAGAPPGGPRALGPSMVPRYEDPLELRVLLGPQDDAFSTHGRETFLGAEFRVTDRNDRMGWRLDGPAVEHAGAADIVSDAVLPGAVQVPGEGRPIIMGVDAQTTGGYAKIATVIGPDLARLAQARPGATVRFRCVSEEEAVGAIRREREAWARLAAALGG